MIDQHGKCPNCNSNWDGGDIAEDIRQHYSEPYKWSRLIGVTIRGKGDRVNHWKCPDCDKEFPR